MEELHDMTSECYQEVTSMATRTTTSKQWQVLETVRLRPGKYYLHAFVNIAPKSKRGTGYVAYQLLGSILPGSQRFVSSVGEMKAITIQHRADVVRPHRAPLLEFVEQTFEEDNFLSVDLVWCADTGKFFTDQVRFCANRE